MKSIVSLAEFYFRSFISFLFFLSLTLQARAHDPGLSSARVTVGDHQIDVLLGFAQKDIESILTDDTNSVDIGTAKGFATVQSELEFVVTNGFSLYWGKQRAIPRQATAQRKDAQNIEISLRFQTPDLGQVRLVPSSAFVTWGASMADLAGPPLIRQTPAVKSKSKAAKSKAGAACPKGG